MANFSLALDTPSHYSSKRSTRHVAPPSLIFKPRQGHQDIINHLDIYKYSLKKFFFVKHYSLREKMATNNTTHDDKQVKGMLLPEVVFTSESGESSSDLNWTTSEEDEAASKKPTQR